MQTWKSRPPPTGFSGDIEMPTLLIENDCICAWMVVRPGPGLQCISRLKYKNNACPHRHRPLAAVPATFSGGG